ncbi:DNA-3-methyladenine glycosylase [Opitutaceae bacterium]
MRAADGKRTGLRITETEAYQGEEDLACHARRGRTARTEVMYAAGGVWYVYLCYGIHEMLNLVTGPRDHPCAILIRGVEGLSGPGRLTRWLGIDRRFNGLAARPATGLWIEDDGFRPAAGEIVATPRIGVDFAGPYWAGLPWRFVWQPAHRNARIANPELGSSVQGTG